MRLTVLGCAGTFPSAESPCSSYLVEHDGFRLMLDAGTGSLGALQRHAGLESVDAVLLSHLHADHCLDLVAWYYARRYRPEGPPDALPVFGPFDLGARVLDVFYGAPQPELDSVYDFRTCGDGVCEIGPFRIERERVAHPVEAYATRISAGGRSLCYSGDTGACPELVHNALDCDLALFEATWLEGCDHPPAVHMTAREAAEHAVKAGVGHLVLTHFVPVWIPVEDTLSEAGQTYSGRLDAATSGMSVDI